MTISPPSNVKLNPGEPARVLAAGIDTLALSINVNWLEAGTLSKLAELKAEAEARDAPVPGVLHLTDGSGAWLFTVKPYGAKGYAYLLDSGEMAWSVGNWMHPRSRPSVFATIRSETLWTHGPDACVDRIVALIAAGNGEIVDVKVSRADPCVDILLRESDWDREIREHLVTRADHRAPYFAGKRRTGIQIGKGQVSARLYDKPLEITMKSNKVWMYDVWGIASIDDDHRIIRVEFELVREGIKRLGIDSYADLRALLPNLWSYCTQKWLRLADDPSEHHSCQSLLPWWPTVQNGIPGAQAANPLIRAIAVKADAEKLCKQMLGYLTSLVALHRQGELIGRDEVLDLASHLPMIIDILRRHGWDNDEFTERVKCKQTQHLRHREKFAAAVRARATLGVSLKASHPPGSLSP